MTPDFYLPNQRVWIRTGNDWEKGVILLQPLHHGCPYVVKADGRKVQYRNECDIRLDLTQE